MSHPGFPSVWTGPDAPAGGSETNTVICRHDRPPYRLLQHVATGKRDCTLLVLPRQAANVRPEIFASGNPVSDAKVALCSEGLQGVDRGASAGRPPGSQWP